MTRRKTIQKVSKKAAPQNCQKWNKFDEAKLLKLFETDAVDLKELSYEYIHNVIEKYFPERPNSSFAPLYKGKVRKYNINKTKTGQRKGKIIAYFLYNIIISTNHSIARCTN